MMNPDYSTNLQSLGGEEYRLSQAFSLPAWGRTVTQGVALGCVLADFQSALLRKSVLNGCLNHLKIGNINSEHQKQAVSLKQHSLGQRPRF